MTKRKKTILSLSVDADLLEKIDLVAQKLSNDPAYQVASWGGRITRSQCVRILLHEAMVKHGALQTELEL